MTCLLMRMILASLLLLVPSVQCEVYQISYNRVSEVWTLNGLEIGVKNASTPGSLAMHVGDPVGSIRWHAVPFPVNFSLISALADPSGVISFDPHYHLDYSLVHNAGDNVYRVTVHHPVYRYVFAHSYGVTHCNIPSHFASIVRCGASTIVFTQSPNVNPSTPSSEYFLVTVTIPPGASPLFTRRVLTVAVAELLHRHEVVGAIISVAQANDYRRQSNRAAVGVLYFFITLSLLGQLGTVIISAGYVAPWFTCFPGCLGDDPSAQVLRSTIFWGIILCISWIVAVSAGGIVGAMALGLAFFIFHVLLLIGTIIHWCCFCRRGAVEPAGGDSKAIDAFDPEEVGAATYRGPAVRAEVSGATTPSNNSGGDGELSPIKWARAGHTPGSTQCRWCLGFLTICVSSFIAVAFAFTLWTVPHWMLIRRTTGLPIEEYQPPNTAKAIQVMYAYENTAQSLRMAIYTRIFTDHCGERFREWVPPRDRREVLKVDWVDEYSLDMEQFVPSDWVAYTSINALFTRYVNPSWRPIAPAPLVSPVSDVKVVSPADARVLVYPRLRDAKVWIKGGKFNRGDLVDPPSQYSWVLSEIDGGTFSIFRLAPQDYHRFHSPISGTIEGAYDLPGHVFSVGSDAAQSANYVFYNQRRVLIIRPDPPVNSSVIVFIAIGATCVASVEWTMGVQNATNAHELALLSAANTPHAPVALHDVIGKHVIAGDEIGYMAFGGSTIVLLSKKGAASSTFC